MLAPWAWIAVLCLTACSDGSGPGVSGSVPLRFSGLAAATGTTCGVTVENVVYCWGKGGAGVLASASLEICTLAPCSTQPVRIQSPVPLSGLSANATFDSYACGLDTGGSPYCWGSILVNVDGSHDFGATPSALQRAAPLTSISAGETHICGVAVSHEVDCWGDFEGGVRGDPLIGFDTSAATFQPNVVGGGIEFTQIAAGALTTCGLTTFGQAYCWGSNNLGGLGNSTAPVQQSCGLAPSPCALVPVLVAGGHQFTSISGSSRHLCGLTALGDAFCWGLDDDHQVGTVAVQAQPCGGSLCVTEPAQVSAQVAFTSISAAGTSTCALSADGVAYCWGDNSSGQLGNGGTPASIPSRVSSSLNFKAIAMSGDHACALLFSGEAYCWGANGEGQLGTGTQDDSSVPVAVVGPAVN